MHFLTLLPLLCLISSVYAGVLDLFGRDRYRAIRPIKGPYSDSSTLIASTSTEPVPSATSTADEVDSVVLTTVTTTTTVTVATATVSTPICVSTTWTGIITAWETTIVIASPVATASPVSQIVVAPSTCLSDPQATNIVNAFHNMLTNLDRSTVNATAVDLIANEYFEMSGSVNSLSGQGVTNITFPTREAYLASLSSAPSIPSLNTLDIFHDCNRIAWYWAVTGLGSGVDEVRGVSLLHTIPVGLEAAAVAVAAGSDVLGATVVVGGAGYGNRKVNMAMLEFNSVAWAKDTGRVLCAGGCKA